MKFSFKRKNLTGFTLVELVLVISVGLMMSFFAFQQMVQKQDDKTAESVGQQLKKIGESVNSYIVTRYEPLSSLSNSTGSTSDPGPRTCSTATNSCTITIQTLINEGMLPNSYSNTNLFSSPYTIILKRSGTAPYYNINGLVTTNNAWIGAGNKIRYDLLGKAMQEAGVDSGVSRDNSTMVNGFKGTWQQLSTNFSNINKQGQLAYQVGYGAFSYSIYLRRDGTLPMTGSLNMNGNDINAAKNITATGNADVTGNITAGGIVKGQAIRSESYVLAKNDYGDYITMGGDGAGNDYELYMSSPTRHLTIFNSGSGGSPTSTNKSNQILKVAGAISSGDVNSVGDVNAGNWLTARNGNGDKMMIGGDTTGDYDIVFQPSSTGNNVVGFFSNGSTTPFDFNFRGNISALTATGTTRNVYLDGSNGNIVASGNITASKTIYGQYLKPTQAVTAGATCSEVGLLARDSVGQILSCVSGIWSPEQPVGAPIPWPSATPPSGWLICNGQTFNTAQYPLLAKAYPSGRLPDLRGVFIRGLDQGRGVDPDSTRAALSTQADSLQNHNHSMPTSTGYVAGSNQGDSTMTSIFIDAKTDVMASIGYDPNNILKNGNNPAPTTNSILRTYDLNYSVGSTPYSTAPRFSKETRPYNVGFVYIVRAL